MKTACVLLLVLVFALGVVSPADAHSWYPNECCSGRDSMVELAGSGHRAQRKQPQSPEENDVHVLTRALLAWIAAKTGLAAPEPPRIAFIPEYQMRQVFDAAAYPNRKPQADVPANQGVSDAHRTSGILAFYLHASATVYLPETWRPGALRDQSILLHELVHHVQVFNKVVPACHAALERQAYGLQATWLRQHGVAEPYELIGTDELTVALRSACIPLGE